MSQDYVLGNDQEELSRLQLQHELWKNELIRLWNLSKIQSAQKVLDLGCGPGFTTMDLISYLQPEAQLTSVDISENFLLFLQQRLTEKKLNQRVQTHKSFIESLDLAEKKFDAAFCRWLMIFVQDPEKAIQTVSRHLKAGSQFVIQEYVSYDSMDLVPDYKHMKPVVQAIFKSWREQGGDPNRGKHLPYWLEKNGFKVTHIEPIAKFARPTDPLWQWPETFYKSFLPRLKDSGHLTTEQVRDFFADWEHSKTSAGSYFVAPTVINIIAEKR